MNTKTEETRHALYRQLESVKKTLKKGFSPRAKMSDFESALEEHLESLRQDLSFMKSQLMTCRDINCGLQLRIQALEHAAHVNGQANLAAGDQIREAQAQNNEFRRNAGSMNLGGFGDAFYKVAEKLGITGARPDSPMQVFASEILPALDAAIRDADNLYKAMNFLQKLCDSAGSQPSVATGYLHDILSVMRTGDQP